MTESEVNDQIMQRQERQTKIDKAREIVSLAGIDAVYHNGLLSIRSKRIGIVIYSPAKGKWSCGKARHHGTPQEFVNWYIRKNRWPR